MGVFRNVQAVVGRTTDAASQRDGRRAGRLAGWLAAGALIVAAVPFMVGPSGASAAVTAPARATTTDVAGFPSWYQDRNGIRVEPCYDPNDANCVAPVSATYDPTKPLAFPGNYPDELFYSAADSDLVVVDDAANCPTFVPPAAVAGAGSRIHMALEASFLNGTLTPGDQMVFGRLRVVSRAGNGLCPQTWYTFRTPYGPMTRKTDDNAEIQGAVASAATSDTGCLPGPITPCNFDLALGAPVLDVGLLHQVNLAAPGYLGSGTPGAGGPALTLDTVVGGKNGFNEFHIVRWPAGATPSSEGVGVDCVDAGCQLLGSTDQFMVAAKLAGPLASSSNIADFGGQVLGTTSTARSLNITNVGAGALGLDSATIAGATITGADADQFAISANDCVAGTILARDAGCAIAVTFTPSATAVASASLDLTVVGADRVLSIALTGTGVTSGQLPAASFTPADGNVDFGAVRVTLGSTPRDVVITNTGQAPLLAVASIVPGADAAAFSVGFNTCSTGYVPAGGSCTVSLKFVPSRVGPFSALLHVDTNLASGAITLSLNGHGTGGIAAVSSTNDPVNTFPDWYQDENGVRVGQCTAPTNTLCIAAPLPNAGPQSFPGNYPDEWFYFIASSVPMNLSDAACNTEPGTIFVEAGMEAAFLGPIGPNQGITFGRLRIINRGGGLCPNTEYLLTHPYGRSIIATDDRGLIKPTAGTTDVGCLGAPCDYTIALSAPVFEGFLTQTVRPDGYLGDPITPSTVTGAPYIDPATGQAANYFNVQRLDTVGQPGSIIGHTDQFGVSGRLVGPMVATPASQDFGSAEAGLASAAVTHTVTFTNDGIAPVVLGTPALSVEGANLGDFTVTASTCAAASTLAVGASCTADVKFFPQATGNRAASLKIHHTGANNPLAVALTGIGLSPAGTAAASPSITSVKFVDLHVGRISESVNVVLSNVGGSSALQVGTPTITAGQPFDISANTCTGNFVQPGATCTISVHFAPTLVGAASATLTIPSNAQSGTLSLPLTGTGTSATPSQSAATTVAGFPSWFQDSNGLRLEPCLAQDGNCILLPDAGFNPALPVAWPTNYPLEAFYALADSEPITIPADSVCGSTGGVATFRAALEGTFGAPATQATAGLQTWFNRIRVTATGLCPNTTYTFTQPYGVLSITTDAAGDVKPKAGTFDNPAITASAPIVPGMVQWDPNVGPAAPAGYLGDARTLHPIVGSQFRLTPTGEPVNFYRISGPRGTVAETKLFTVSGRKPGALVSNPETKDFGPVEMAKTSATQNFVITNLGSSPVSALTTTLGGTGSALYTITSNTCTAAGLTLATDQSCAISVQFKPTVAAGIGVKPATLTVGHNGLRAPLVVTLSGEAVAASTPAVRLSATTLAFGSVVLNTTTTQQTVTITNSGTGNLRLGALSVTGTGATQFRIASTTCSTVNVLRPAQSCAVNITFTPTTSGAKTASIVVSATDAVAAGGHVAVVIPNQTIALTGTGAQGTISVAATTTVRTRAGTTGTARVTLTNTGTAPFSLAGTPFFTVATVSGTNAAQRFSAAQVGCNNVAVGKNCSVTISFTPPAGTAANTVFTVDISMTSNASNNPVKVRVTGTTL